MSSTINIAVIGSGHLGSRHLQALALIDRPVSLTVVDPVGQVLATARERFEQVNKANKRSQIKAIRYLRSMREMPGEIAFAVIATRSDVRREVIEELLATTNVDNLLLEKVLFQRLEDYEAVGELLQRNRVHAWINCSQRMWPFFRDLKRKLDAPHNVQVIVAGSNWGLGCNAIHNIDLLPFLTGDSLLKVTAVLEPGAIASKRPGFIEFTGTLYCRDGHGNSVIQTSYREGNAPFTIEVLASNLHYVWRVMEGRALIADDENGWNWREVETRVPYQSELTHLVAQSILDRGACELPDYAESAASHVMLLEVLLQHMRNSGNADTTVCRIT